LFLRYLPSSATRNDVKTHFRKFGYVEDAAVLDKGLGFVLFDLPAAANKALMEECIIRGTKVAFGGGDGDGGIYLSTCVCV